MSRSGQELMSAIEDQMLDFMEQLRKDNSEVMFSTLILRTNDGILVLGNDQATRDIIETAANKASPEMDIERDIEKRRVAVGVSDALTEVAIMFDGVMATARDTMVFEIGQRIVPLLKEKIVVDLDDKRITMSTLYAKENHLL